jgi:hypothetical protein
VTEQFASREMRFVSSASKRLSVFLVGYIYKNARPILASALVSNYQDPIARSESVRASNVFRVFYRSQPEPFDAPFSFVQRLGQWQLLTNKQIAPIAALLSRGAPAHAIVNKAVETFRSVAESSAAAGTVGKQITSIILPAASERRAEAGYHSAVNATTVFFPGEVICRPGLPALALGELSITPTDASGASAVMATRPVRRNAPCPCGSGKKYKRCHLKLRPRMR